MDEESLSSRPPQFVLVREIYDRGDGQESFELELENALEAKAETIVIEPVKLGEETARWITVGNCLHKTAVVSGIASLIIGYKWTDSGLFYYPLGFISVVCSGVYAVSWQFDPCCKYQIEKDKRKLEEHIPLHRLTSESPVVLIRRDDSRRKILQNLVSLASIAFCSWKLYEWYRQ